MHRRPNENAGAQAWSLDYEEDHRHELEDAAGEHPQVKHAVQIAHVFGDIERHARGVAHAADGEQGKCHGVEQRNKFSVGDTVEIIQPGKPYFSQKVEWLNDASGAPIMSTPHPQMVFTMPLDAPAVPNAMLRKGALVSGK